MLTAGTAALRARARRVDRSQDAANLKSVALTSRSVDETIQIGHRLGAALSGGELIALTGPLGAGKTHFVKGLALGLGVSAAEPVVSPTFMLVREYAGRVALLHLDLYRLAGADDLLAIGWQEMRARRDAVLAVEWSERAAELFGDAIRVTLAHLAHDQRRIEICGATHGPDAAALRSALRAADRPTG